jgi:hypothetical protein
VLSHENRWKNALFIFNFFAKTKKYVFYETLMWPSTEPSNKKLSKSLSNTILMGANYFPPIFIRKVEKKGWEIKVKNRFWNFDETYFITTDFFYIINTYLNTEQITVTSIHRFMTKYSKKKTSKILMKFKIKDFIELIAFICFFCDKLFMFVLFLDFFFLYKINRYCEIFLFIEKKKIYKFLIILNFIHITHTHVTITCKLY